MICFTLFCREIFFDGIYTVLLQNPFYCNSCCLLQDLFCCDLRTFSVETNYAHVFVRGEKMTNIMSHCKWWPCTIHLNLYLGYITLHCIIVWGGFNKSNQYNKFIKLHHIALYHCVGRLTVAQYISCCYYCIWLRWKSNLSWWKGFQTYWRETG